MSNLKLFIPAFQELGKQFRSDEWEVRFETPPGAYLHVSKANWGDETMNGVHLEAYVCSTPEGHGGAVVALHCERACPGSNREELMTALAKRVEAEVHTWTEEGANGKKVWTKVLPRGVKDCTVVESRFSFPLSGVVPAAIMGRIEDLLRKLQQNLTAHIDAAIESVVS